MTDQMKHYLAQRDKLQTLGAYNPAWEHDACGVGMVTAIDGKPNREVVTAAIAALKAVWHRGAVDADGKTGDGAGILLNIPQAFFRRVVERTGHSTTPDTRIAVGMVFLPRNDHEAQETCRVCVESEVLKTGFSIFGWRRVPVNTQVLGQKANSTRPEIEQLLLDITHFEGLDSELESKLYLVRRRIENKLRARGVQDFYICSLSAQSLVYKGMFLAQDLSEFFPDLTDVRFISNVALYHQRYSTNTFPQWRLAQPFRMLAHNGEINTLKGNENWMRAHETKISHPSLDAHLEDVKPVIQPGSSDTAALDAVFELMCITGRELPMAKAMMIPEAWAFNQLMPQNYRDFYRYCNAVMEPWDGPAAIVATQGPWALCGMDRSGLRPMRYCITKTGLLIAGSETGMVRVHDEDLLELGRIGPGEMIAVNLEEGRFYKDNEIKDKLVRRQNWGAWVANETSLDTEASKLPKASWHFEGEALRRRQLCFGYSMETLELILQPMIESGKEATGSMGDDTPMAVISEEYRPLHHFFRQDFSQVTNPPIDSLRERRSMTLVTRLGNLGNVLDENPKQCALYRLSSPVLTNSEFDHMCQTLEARGSKVVTIDCLFDPKAGINALAASLQQIRQEAEHAVRKGAEHIVLSDYKVDINKAPLPMILATGAVHTYLLAKNLRTFVSLNIRSGECLDTHYYAVLIGVGATTINAYMVQETIAERMRRNLLPEGMNLDKAITNYKKAVNDGILKIMSKMGIGVLSSYRGGSNFEAIGLSRTLVDEYLPGIPSRISGIGLKGIQQKILTLYQKAFSQVSTPLPIGGFYRYRRSSERHAWEAENMHLLQSAIDKQSYATYKKYLKSVYKADPIWLRDLLDFDHRRCKPIDLDEVESVTSIRKRFVSPGISLGALSKEAHETLAIAMNRMGARSDSGEGGEDAQRYTPFHNGDNANSAIKQVASGRFGVTAEYLNNCTELEIKVAQGAKPGEGGQLPGFKVTGYIAKLRHSTPGVTLISPPPHHDIYSIEDLAQLIYDLKQINPRARVCVKLVARSGIGTIAAGVAKAKADAILISGYSGGTGASPQTSIKYAGLPWEMGLAEVHQVLSINNLRSCVTLRTDGGIRTGRDVVIAAMLGAEEYGIGTAGLIALGCIMVRQCHSNTCPVGVCTQDEKLRAKFKGSPEKVITLFSYIAEEVREILAELGFHRLEDVVGRTDLLAQVTRGAEHLDDLDLNTILAKVESPDGKIQLSSLTKINEVPETLDAQIIKDAQPLFDAGEKMQLNYSIRNTHRSIGTRLASKITTTFGMEYFKDGHVFLRLRGTAGQSLGAFAVKGMHIEVRGDANDYVGKGLSGGVIVIRPPSNSPLLNQTQNHVIIGNTVLYGATKGALFASGRAGERFCVRNSGATAVVEGCGSNGLEYMTGGIAVILGPVGENFAAGMTGGMAFVYDPEDDLPKRLNPESVLIQRIEMPHYEAQLKALITRHKQHSQSQHAERLLLDWESFIAKVYQVVPYEMIPLLEQPINAEQKRRA